MPAIRPFSNFPKHREPLPREFEAIYSEHYRMNREGASRASSLAQKMEGWMHRKVSEDVGEGGPWPTLEIGAGTLNHLRYEPLSTRYDIVEPFGYLYESSENLRRVGRIFTHIREIPAGAQI